MEVNAPSVEPSAGGFPSKCLTFFFFFFTEKYHYIKSRSAVSTLMSHFFLLKI